MKIGFIGLGNMATAMIGGMLQKGIAKPEDIIGSSKTETTAEKVKTKFNINTTTDNTAVAEQADILFLAVKPIFFPEVIAEIKDAVKADTLIVSIAAGRNLQYLKDAFGRPELKLIRCMPNRRPWYWRAVPVYASEKMSRRMRQSRCFPCSVPSASQVSYRSV